MKTLAEDTHVKIVQRVTRGDELCESSRSRDAIAEYEKALERLPQPFSDWDAAAHILAAVGDAHYLAGEYGEAETALVAAMHCPGAIGNPFLHLRLGQCAFKKGNRRRAADELTRAYMGGGKEIFDGEEPEYFVFIKTILKEPPGGW